MSKIVHKLKVKNDLGLHTRPATAIVKLLRQFKSQVNFTYKSDTINAKSIMGILMLAARKNARIEVTAEGEDAQEAIESLSDAFEHCFYEKIM